MKSSIHRKVSLTLKQIFVLTVILSTLPSGTIYSQQQAYRGIIHLGGVSACMDACSYYYLEPDSGYAFTWLAGNLGGYVGLHVEVIGMRIHCVECTALQVSEIRMQESFNVEQRWNMLSVPLKVSDYRKTALFPTAVSAAFAYHGNYLQEDVLSVGQGYWLKFDSAQTVSLVDTVMAVDSIDVVEGWNLVGSISFPVATTDVTSEQSGMTTSDFYDYKNGYFIADTIKPGKGYWVKVNQDGKLILATTGMGSFQQATLSTNRISIRPTDEQPPPPPSVGNSKDKAQVPIQFALSQNYPNPFNPTTVIGFSIPREDHIVLEVFNTIGQRVATLIDGRLDQGIHAVFFDASRFNSGMYCYRLRGSLGTITRKMLILR